MPRQCIFCPNPANSKEHLWPEWALKSIGRHRPIVRRTHGVPGKEFQSPISVKHVCRECNSGWMSALESDIKSYVQPMLHGVALALTKEQQAAICAWALKTAMVLQATTEAKNRFYTRAERESLRLSSAIPRRSLAWLGRFSTSDGLLSDGTNIFLNVDKAPKAADGCVTTIIMGQFLVQVLTIHYPPQYDSKTIRVHCGNGPWDKALIGIYPHAPRVEWPPVHTFTERGPISFVWLLNRWQLGVRQT